MWREALPIAIFLVIKLVAYAAWCGLGLRWFRPGERVRPGQAFALAALRVVIGIALGAALAGTVALLVPEQNRIGFSLPFFGVALVALRWLEWGVVGTLIDRGDWRPGAMLLGTRPRATLWRAGGVGVSFLTDVAALFGAVGGGLNLC